MSAADGPPPLVQADFSPGLPGVQGVAIELGEPSRALPELARLASLPAELERAVPKRRAEFLAGRHAARLALARLGRAGAVGRAPNGSPAWPEGVVGSITHGAGLAAAAVASSGTHLGLGIDVECVMHAKTAADLSRKIATPEELALVGAGSALSPELALSLIFSVKESLFKCTHPRTAEFLWFPDVRLRGFRCVSESAAECALDVARPRSQALLATGTLSALVTWSAERVSSSVALTRAAD